MFKNIIFKQFEIYPFLFLNSFVFIWGFINTDSIYPISEALIMSLLFLIVIFIQSLVCFFTKKNGFIFNLFFSCGNLIYFNLIFNGKSISLNLLYLFVFFLLVLFLSLIKEKTIKQYFSILILTTVLSNLFYRYDHQDISLNYINKGLKRKESNKNIFFIGIDGMISKEMYLNYFLVQSPAYKCLDNLGFHSFDIFSPGFGTLETYAKLFSYQSLIHTRESLKIINSKNAPFYSETKRLGYKKQFNFYTNYFGGDPNSIFDSYYPKINKPFSFVLYTDDRWGWYLAYAIKNIFNFKSDTYSNQFDMIFNRISSLNINYNNWVSISHLWFPGHTLGSYNFNEGKDYENFKTYYNNSQRELSKFFTKISEMILEKDKNAVIVFYGDHGAYFLKGATNNEKKNGLHITNKFLLKDQKHVLISIYPKTFLNPKDIYEIRNNPENLFKIILNK